MTHGYPGPMAEVFCPVPIKSPDTVTYGSISAQQPSAFSLRVVRPETERYIFPGMGNASPQAADFLMDLHSSHS